MPTTSNFGWTTPADTDLVKDGAAAIRTLGNGIDTSFVDLKGGTTGQVLSKASNTDLDFSWVAQDDSNAIQNALLTTTGDTIYASAASTPARLGIGSSGQVLTVAGGVPSWATPSSGALVKISRTTYSAVANQSFDNVFSSTYKSYLVVIENHFGSGNTNLYWRFKDGSTLQQTSYNGQSFSYNNAGTLATNASSNAAALLIVAAVGASGTDSTSAHFFVHNVGVSNANGVFSQVAGQAISSGNGKISTIGGAHKLNNANNTGFYLDPDSGTISGTVTVYGLAI